jgi:hypothetical protein
MQLEYQQEHPKSRSRSPQPIYWVRKGFRGSSRRSIRRRRVLASAPARAVELPCYLRHASSVPAKGAPRMIMKLLIGMALMALCVVIHAGGWRGRCGGCARPEGGRLASGR